MSYRTYINKLERIKFLAERKMTGSPKNLAEKLDVSERTLFRMVEDLRLTGYELYFCRYEKSYVLEKEKT